MEGYSPNIVVKMSFCDGLLLLLEQLKTVSVFIRKITRTVGDKTDALMAVTDKPLSGDLTTECIWN